MSTAMDWKETGRRKREDIQALLPTRWKVDEPLPTSSELRDATKYPRKFLTPREVNITENFTAQELLKALASSALSAVEVTAAFCHRATIAHQVVNCLSEVFFETALQRAAELDEHLKIHGRPIGPLHGLPISLKDQFRVNGLETSVGYVGWLGKKETAESESYLVKILREHGAVFYVKTNVPTSLMAIETNNNIIGYTWNAHNRLLSSGGSSGGEAALLAMRGSVLGLGSDVGASIRLPAAVSGLVGLKPSTGRLPYLRVANSMEGQETVSSVIGPMGRNPQDLQMLVRSILDSNPWIDDPKTLNMPWRVQEEDAIRTKAQRIGLTFGVMKYDGLVMPHPPVLRAINECVTSLKSQGHEVIEWKPPSHDEAFDILFKTFLADGGTDIHRALSLVGEVPVPQLEVSYGKVLGSVPVSTLNEIWALQKRKDEYQTRYLQYWNSTAELSRSRSPVDAVILPACPSASFKPGESMYFGYTGVANVLDYATAVVPVTFVDAGIDVPNEKYSPSGDIDQKIKADYHPQLFHGTPVGVQLMGRRLAEEQILATAEEVMRCLQSTQSKDALGLA